MKNGLAINGRIWMRYVSTIWTFGDDQQQRDRDRLERHDDERYDNTE